MILFFDTRHPQDASLKLRSHFKASLDAALGIGFDPIRRPNNSFHPFQF